MIMEILKPIPLQKGFGLLEVLITIIVLGVTLFALARLQALLLQEGSYAKGRSVALNLAQGKLEDLRGFARLKAVGNGTFAYAEIGEGNTGGVENADGSLINPSGDDISVSNVTYNRTWTVKSYYYCPGKNVDENNCDEPYEKSYPDFKVVKVTVTWDDPDGKVELESAISASEPADEARAIMNER
jgi:prepilin-type N-terminal cleavage/methylation domain-containing protein